jgi:DNA-binding transcriptional ArsR family regulator
MSSEHEPPASRPDSDSEPVGGEPGQVSEETPSLSDPKAMRALAHPVRIALLELLGIAGTLTATQASEALGESPANCAFHLRTLARYGFVKEAGGGRGRERPWTIAQRTIKISATEQSDPQAALAAEALSQLWLNRWLDRARRVFGTTARVPGWEHATHWTRSSVFLTAEEAEQMTRDVMRLVDRYTDREDDPSLRPAGSLPVDCSFFTFPMTEFDRPKASQSQDIS